MKTRKFDKKLSLNKKTVSNLSVQEMKCVNGGVDGCICGCTCCCTVDFRLCNPTLQTKVCYCPPAPTATCDGRYTCIDITKCP